MTAVERAEPSRAEPGWMGGKQGVRGALLEAAGLSLPAVPCRAEPPRPPYYSLLQKNSSRLNEKSFPGGEAGDQLVTSSTSTIMAAVRVRNKLPNSRGVRSADAFAALQYHFKMMESFRWTSGSAGQNYCTAAAAVALRSSNRLLQRSKFNLVSRRNTWGGRLGVQVQGQVQIELPGVPLRSLPIQFILIN